MLPGIPTEYMHVFDIKFLFLIVSELISLLVVSFLVVCFVWILLLYQQFVSEYSTVIQLNSALL